MLSSEVDKAGCVRQMRVPRPHDLCSWRPNLSLGHPQPQNVDQVL